MTKPTASKLVTIEIDAALYQVLDTIAAMDGRSAAQAASSIVEERLRLRSGRHTQEDIPSLEIAKLAQAADSHVWLAEEPDLYNDTFGEPI